MSYQESDRKLIDYGEVPLPGTKVRVRGPLPLCLDPGSYIATIGAAQTFGRFVSEPYSALLSKAVKFPILNLGFAGLGPDHMFRTSNVLKYAINAKLVILQVMSGRSVSNSVFENTSAGNLRLRNSNSEPIHAEIAYDNWLKTVNRQRIIDVVAETRAIYMQETLKLIHALPCPKILLWFSTRSPDYHERYSAAGALFGAFPQLINAEMITKLVPVVETYVECVTSEGLPQPLFDKETGKPFLMNPATAWPYHNNYYPSPEMHRNASSALEPAVRRHLAASST